MYKKSIECLIVFNGKKYDLESALRSHNKKIGYLYHKSIQKLKLTNILSNILKRLTRTTELYTQHHGV
jgi:hypothetical protein